MTLGVLPAPRAFVAPGAPPVGLTLVLPDAITARTRLVVVLHGVLRNAGEYAEDWRAWAWARDRVVACPGFERAHWPRGSSYNLGSVMTGGHGRGVPKPPERWAFTVVERLAAHLREELGLAHEDFDLWGHSAGGQFAHRFPLFRPEAPVRRIVAAGSGWYTTPDRDVAFPHGVRQPALGFDAAAVRRWTRRDLTLLRGSRDVLRDEHLRCDPASERQGATRWERAAYMHGRALAVDPGTRWRLVDVPGAGHDHSAMARATQALWDARDAGERAK